MDAISRGNPHGRGKPQKIKVFYPRKGHQATPNFSYLERILGGTYCFVITPDYLYYKTRQEGKSTPAGEEKTMIFFPTLIIPAGDYPKPVTYL